MEAISQVMFFSNISSEGTRDFSIILEDAILGLEVSLGIGSGCQNDPGTLIFYLKAKFLGIGIMSAFYRFLFMYLILTPHENGKNRLIMTKNRRSCQRHTFSPLLQGNPV